MRVERKKLDYEPEECSLIEKDVKSKLSFKINEQLENYIIYGLKRKGFEFENIIELQNFIELNCLCEDRTDIKQRIYLVNNVPFLVHFYEIEMDFNEKKMSVNYGSYAYV